MSTLFYICMTSGIRGPEGELTKELSKEILDLAGQLTEPWTGPKKEGRGLSGLSSTNYLVYWEDDNAMISSLRATPNGYVTIWKKGDVDWQEYTDTLGIWAKLAPTGAVTLQKWFDDSRKAAEDAALNLNISDP